MSLIIFEYLINGINVKTETQRIDKSTFFLFVVKYYFKNILMKKPTLIIKKDLIEPLNQALDRIESIRHRKANNEDRIILEGLLVLAVSTFEIFISDTLRIFLRNFPEKLDSTIEKISKEDLLEGSLLDSIIETKIISISYKNLSDIFTYFYKITGIDKNAISVELFENLLEIKATRNLILHNNLIVNDIYINCAGKKLRESKIGNRLTIDQTYLFDSIICFRDVLNIFKTKLNNKYVNYTYLRALKELFMFTLDTPIMVFENEWIVDIDRDVIINHNSERSLRAGLSSGEEMIYNVWYSHIKGRELLFLNYNFFTIRGDFREKMSFLIKNIDLLKRIG